MRSELDVQHIAGKKYLQTTKTSMLLLICCDRVLRLKEMHITALTEKSSS